MMRARFTGLLLVLLLSLLAVADSTAASQHAPGTAYRVPSAILDAQGVNVTDKSIGGSIRRLWIVQGRKMRAAMRGEQMGKNLKTGAKPSVGKRGHLDDSLRGLGKFNIGWLAKKSPHKPLRTWNKRRKDRKPQKSTSVIEASSKATELKESSFRIPSLDRNLESKETPEVLHRATDRSHGKQAKKLMETVSKLYNMMARDYHFKARRKPPINNHQPINDFYREP